MSEPSLRARTTQAPLREWVRHPAFHGWDPDTCDLVDSGLLDPSSPNRLMADDLATSGISKVDLERRRTLHHPETDANFAAAFVFGSLARLLTTAPDLSVRDALGYEFVSQQVRAGSNGPTLIYTMWDDVGHGADGWLLTAAGVQVDEVENGLVVDRDAVAALAGLRGMTLPC
jgi:hypothetical protein